MPQTSVASEVSRGFPGMIADSNMNKDVRSYANAEASAEIPFGTMVKHDGTSETKAVKLTATTDKPIFCGIVTHSHAYARPQEVGDTGLKPKTTLGCMWKGTIWVPVEDAVDPSKKVYCRAVATGDEQAGAFRGSADGSDTIDCSNFARWVSATTGAGVAQLKFDLDNAGSDVAD